MATAKIEAHNIRVRDALILPFKRRIASLAIRTDIWKDTLAGSKSAGVDGQVETRSRALGAITEVDDLVSLLMDLKLPGEKKARDSEAEVKRLAEAFAAMRLVLVGMAGKTAAA